MALSKRKPKSLKDRHPAEAFIHRGYLTINIHLDHIPGAVQGGCDMGAIDPPFKVVDVEAFARETCRALNHEDEQGTTAIHRLFDQAYMDAVNDGAEGVILQERDDDGQVRDLP